MNRFARALAVTLGLVVLGSFVLLVPQKNATATSGAPVTVMNTATNPVPVTAQQSGNWNVGITGTPNVSVGNFPSHLLYERRPDDPPSVWGDFSD